MKRLRSSDDDLDSYNNKDSNAPNRSTSSSHRSFYYNHNNKPSDRNNRGFDDSRKRLDHDAAAPAADNFDRKKLSDNRYRGSGEGYSSSGNNNNNNAGGERGIFRSESFCGVRRDVPKGFRSERERSRRDDSSWRRFKDFDDISSATGNRKGFETASSGKGLLKDVAVKSPSSWSRESGSDQTRSKPDGDVKVDKDNSKRLKMKASPSCSKDSISGSEQSKSVELKKTEKSVKNKAAEKSEKGKSADKSEKEKSADKNEKSIPAQKNEISKSAEKNENLPEETESSSEMEEGELGPEPIAEVKAGNEPSFKNENVTQVKDDVIRFNADHVKVGVETENVMEEVNKDTHEQASEKKDNDIDVTSMKEVDKSPDNCEHLMDKVGNSVKTDGVNLVGDHVEENSERKGGEKTKIDDNDENEKSEAEKRLDLDPNMKETTNKMEISNEVVQQNDHGAKATMDFVTESSIFNLKDKGKSIAVSPCLVSNSRKDSTFVADGDDDMEGPSTRGFELFSSSPVRRTEKPENSSGSKQKDEKLSFEPLDLSLSLPNVLLPLGAARDPSAVGPGSPSQARSVQSLSNTFQTNSDGFTASMSFSGSQPFHHNPSCSLTHNSMGDFEQSVHSRPLFQGIDWQAQNSQNDSRQTKEVPLYQRILMNGNGSQALEGSSKVPTNGLERQLSFHKQNDVRSPTQSVGSYDVGGSNYSFEKKRATREKHGGSSLYRSSSLKEQEQLPIGGADFVETIISRIVSEPIHIMARKFHEMTSQSISCLKESIREIMLNTDKHGQLRLIQNALHNRSDISIDLLTKAHRPQLEILAALRTGITEFLHVDSGISTSDLAEIILNLRCRNLTCRNLLPVDECDCKVCSKKTGFCSACMCQVCSKFDMASNTCSWVGCDVCLHWCHADCGLRESFVRNGRSPTGTTEMQFHCVACDHPSEMFGFVKEVFQNFAKEWTAENFARELEYVKRIFSASKDIRGKRLHDIAGQLLPRLGYNKSSLQEVYSHIMGFLTVADRESAKLSNVPTLSGKQSKEQSKASNNGIAGPSQDNSWFKSSYTDKPSHLDRSSSLLPIYENDRSTEKRHLESELYKNPQKDPEPVFDELDSIIRIKQAEATMFQSRADDARRESEGLKRIAIAKNEKIDDEYASRIAKLRLMEAEEIRKQKLEELQALERAHREYFNMKMRMEADIKDLLLKMEATKRNLAM
ncbi:hypothetical protein ACFE04_003611 [Oxalis oulophora]